MANEVEIVVSGTDKTDKAFASVRSRASAFGVGLRQILGRAGRDAGADLGNGIVRGVDGRLRDARGRFVAEGRSIGRSLADGLRRGGQSIRQALESVLTGSLKGALGTPILGPIILAALTTALVGGGVTLGAALSGAIITGLGAGLVGVGAAALFHVEEINKEWSKAEQKRVKESNRQAEKLRKQWTELTRDIVGGLKRAAQPLIPVLDVVRSTLRNVGREFEPVIKQGLKIAQGPLKRFVRDLGSAFLELKPAVAPVMLAFGQLLDQIGPSLPGIFSQLADSIIELAGIVSENRDLIASIFLGLLATIPIVINLLGAVASAARGGLTMFMGLIDGILGGMQSLMEVIARIPGPWQDSAAQIAASIQGTRNELAGMRAQVENFPKVVKLEGEIRDLEGKIATAKAKLRDPKLTRPERARIRAEISDLQRKVAAAKAALASVQSKTVLVSMIYRYSTVGRGTVLAPGHAHGGVIGGLGGIKRFAQGGVSGSGSSLAMVGEQGPELVRLPVGSTVTPAGQTRALMGSGFGSISMAFRQAGGAGGGDLAGSMRDLATALREVVSLRDGLDKLTGSVFGQTRALMAYEEAWDAAQRSLKENGKTLNITREKGRENRASLLSLAEAAHQVVIAMREKGSSITTVTKKMAEQRREFIRMARAFGLTSKQAGAMADRLGLIPSQVKKILEKEKRDLAYNKSIERSGRASGGVAGGWTMVGERGPELVKLPFGSSVTSANQTAAMMAAGGGTLNIALEVRGGQSEFDKFMAAWIRKFVRVTGGGNVQTAFGRT